jgi:hypothetical protein
MARDTPTAALAPLQQSVRSAPRLDPSEFSTLTKEAQP